MNNTIAPLIGLAALLADAPVSVAPMPVRGVQPQPNGVTLAMPQDRIILSFDFTALQTGPGDSAFPIWAGTGVGNPLDFPRPYLVYFTRLVYNSHASHFYIRQADPRAGRADASDHA